VLPISPVGLQACQTRRYYRRRWIRPWRWFNYLTCRVRDLTTTHS